MLREYLPYVKLSTFSNQPFSQTLMKQLKYASILIAWLSAMACSNAVTTNNAVPNAASANAGVNRMPEVTPAPESGAVSELTMGKEIYATNCMICHKNTAKGGKMTLGGKSINPDDLTTAKMKAMTDEKLIGYVKNGIEDEGMPAFKEKLTDDEIKSVIAHVRTLQN